MERQPTRADRYLRLPGSDGLNVKVREGRLEIKQRVGRVSATRLHEHVVGVVEGWRKWSFELAAPGSAHARTTSSASSWIVVRKERRLRTYQVKDGEDVVARPSSEAPAHGCELELTRVRAAGQTWWTLAFEAFGDEHTLRDDLLLVARHVFKAAEPPWLAVGKSRGYAAWLTGLAHAKGRP